MKSIKQFIFFLLLFSSLLTKANNHNVFNNDEIPNGNVFNTESSIGQPPSPGDEGGGTTGTGTPEPVIIDNHLFLLGLIGVIIIVFSKIKLFGIRIGKKKEVERKHSEIISISNAELSKKLGDKSLN